MNLLHALILSVVEGITEFLPISSTGHLILASSILKVSQTDFVKSFEISIQAGAILAVVVLYGKNLLTNIVLLKKTIIAFIPTLIVGLALYKIIKTLLIGNEEITLLSLFFGGVALILLELYFKQKEHKATINTLSYGKVILIGFFQSISIIPGVSRSAATIVGGLFAGLSRSEATEFSFMLAIPTMFAASALDLVKSSTSFTTNEIQTLIIGLVISFIVAIVAVRWFINYVKGHTFIPFGIYRIAVAILFFLLLFR